MSVVVVCDLSASIEPEARASMFTAVESVVGVLHRGDSLSVIPVTGDAEVETSGHVLRFRVPVNREVYDDDLRRLSTSAQKALHEVELQAMTAPGSRTDLLGAVRAASEELAGLSAGQHGAVVILSDFIQDDDQFNFNTDRALSATASAKQLAARLSQGSAQPFKNMPIFLGCLRSRDLGRLSRARREAIQEFWREYLTRLGGRTESVLDGPGLLPRFLDKIRAPQGGNSKIAANPVNRP